MLPITRATVDNFCMVCLHVLRKTGDTPHHDLQNDPQLLRVCNAMSKGTLIKMSMPKLLCHSCYTKVFMFCKFAEMSICSSISMNELAKEEHNEISEKNLRRICTMCFKLGPEQNTSILHQSELQDLWGLIFMGMETQGFVHVKNICELCAQKSKTFMEFQRRLRESQQYFKSMLSHAEDLTEEHSRPHSNNSKALADVFGNDSEPEIDNITTLGDETDEKHDPFGLCESISSDGKSAITSFSRCTKCHRSFRKLCSFEAHKCREQITEEAQDVYTCGICHKDYKSEALLRTHNYRVHCKANKKCPYCQREFKQKHHLNDHIRSVHENIRNHKCSYCDKSFGLPKTLRVHLMGHTNERPFQCEICTKTFRQRAELNRHIKNHSSDMQFRCPVCSQGQSSQVELDEHLTRHNNREGYQCSKCGRKFTKLCHLKNHDDAVHLKLRPFKCDYNDCGKSFAARKTLQIHQLTHTGDFSNICNVCHKEFSCKANLLRHFYMHKTQVKQETHM